MYKPLWDMQLVKESNPGQGEGALEKYMCLTGGEAPPHIEFVVRVFLKPGSSIGTHKHEGNGEIWYYIQGEGEYTEDENTVQVRPGDVTVCHSGSCHSLRNTSDADLEYLAVKFVV